MKIQGEEVQKIYQKNRKEFIGDQTKSYLLPPMNNNTINKKHPYLPLNTS